MAIVSSVVCVDKQRGRLRNVGLGLGFGASDVIVDRKMRPRQRRRRIINFSIMPSSSSFSLIMMMMLLLLSVVMVMVGADTILIEEESGSGEFVYDKAIVHGMNKIMDIAWMPNNYQGHDALVATKDGKIWIYPQGDFEEVHQRKQLLINVDPCLDTEMALQSIAVHPMFGTTTTPTSTSDEDVENENGSNTFDYVYAYWNHRGKDGNCTIIEDIEGGIETIVNTIDGDGKDGTTSFGLPYQQLSRFHYNPITYTLEKEEILLTTGNSNKMHNGGGMAFGPNDGYLYLSIGDAGYPVQYDPANHLDNLFGKILRIQDDGSIPMDNPYYNNTNSQRCGTRIINPGYDDGVIDKGNSNSNSNSSSNDNDSDTTPQQQQQQRKQRVCSEIYATGLRNPFSLEMNPNVIDEGGGIVEFYVADVGRKDWEELNIGGTLYAKANYGWREREGPCLMGTRDSHSCNPPNKTEKFQDPFYWSEHPPDTGYAIVGGAFVPNGIWPTQYDNEYLYSEYRSKSILHLKYDPTHYCRGSLCVDSIDSDDGHTITGQKSKYVPTPIVKDIEPGRGSLRLRFGPNNKREGLISLYHIQYSNGEINRLTYIKKENNNEEEKDNDSDDDNNKRPTAIIQTLYSSTKDGVTVYFDGSKSYDPSDDDDDDDDDDDLIYRWDSGDDNHSIITTTSIGVKTSYTYHNPGTYIATLVVIDGKGLESTKTEVEIHIDDDYHRSSDQDYGSETLPTFEWKNDDQCDDNDFCGILEFCYNEDTGVYGYHQPGNGSSKSSTSSSTSSTSTTTTITCQSSLKMGVAPVIRLEAGNTYRLTVRNLSDREPTNIHTHGLHVVGSGSGDDITRIIKASTDNDDDDDSNSNCLDYIWDIRSDHPGGTYWYHPHAHSYSERQINGGATGLLIVEDNNKNDPNIPSWTSNELLLQILRLDENGQIMVSNGRSYEIFNLIVGKWYRLRVSTVDPLGVANDLQFAKGGVCEIHKVASDGIWHSVVPFDDDDDNIANVDDESISFPMTGSSRGDFAIRCNNKSDTDNKDYDSYINILFGNKISAIINIKSDIDKSSNLRGGNELGRWIPNRPDSIRSMISETVPDENKLRIGVSRESINGKTWDKDIPLSTLAYNEVHEWELPNTVDHPFHTHLYHMQIVEQGGCGKNGAYREGEFYDTICTDQPCTVRFRTSDFGQRMVVHCHVMFHSDLGSMAWFDVQGDNMPLYETVLSNYDCKSSSSLSLPLPLPLPIPEVWLVPAVQKVRFAPRPSEGGLLPPITWGALDYDEAYKRPISLINETSTIAVNQYCTNLYNDEKHHNNDGDGVLTQRKSDETCIIRDGSECNIAYWEPEEYLLYHFSIPQSSGSGSRSEKYNIRIRVSTKKTGKNIALNLLTSTMVVPATTKRDNSGLGGRVDSLLGGRNGGSDSDGDESSSSSSSEHHQRERVLLDTKSFTVPVKGWDTFDDLVWESLDLEPNDYTLKVISTTGHVNLCSTSIIAVNSDSDTITTSSSSTDNTSTNTDL